MREIEKLETEVAELRRRVEELEQSKGKVGMDGVIGEVREICLDLVECIAGFRAELDRIGGKGIRKWH